MADVALVTARDARKRDDDLPLLTAALERRTISSEIVVWDDAAVTWASFRLAVVRSTWDYALRRDEFLSWSEAVGGETVLLNPPDVLRWNTDKRYLRDLGAGGIPIVPTTWLEPGDAAHVVRDGDLVVKPAVSAGARDTARYGDDDVGSAAAHAHAAALLSEGRAVMIQPYVAAIDEAGETGLVFLGDAYSHAIRKAPILRPDLRFVAGLYAEERISPRSPAVDELTLAERVLDLVPGGRGRLLYARVDLVRDDGGRPMLLELEVAEPSLFVDRARGAADRFAVAVERVLR